MTVHMAFVHDRTIMKDKVIITGAISFRAHY
jgi:hypothetical protein